MQLVSTLATGEVQPRPRKSPRNQLGDLAQRIRDKHQDVLKAEDIFSVAVRGAVVHAMAAGDLLIEAKQHLPHGQWSDWLKGSCKIPERTAQVYMQLAHNREAVEAQHAADLRLSLRGALKTIAPPKTKTTPGPSKTTAQPVIECGPKKRSTHHELMAVWLNTPDEERALFINSIGLDPILKAVPKDWHNSLRLRLGEE